MSTLRPERFQQIDALFEAVLEQPPDQRLAFVRKACERDADLLEGIKALLEIQSEAEKKLGESALQYAAPVIRDLLKKVPSSPGSRRGT